MSASASIMDAFRRDGETAKNGDFRDVLLPDRSGESEGVWSAPSALETRWGRFLGLAPQSMVGAGRWPSIGGVQSPKSKVLF